MFFGKKILVGVTGGIAAYKAAYLVRELKKLGADVHVMMTEAATKFVAPLTFESLTEHKAAVNLFDDGHDAATAHIDWARWPDLIIVCPATANTIAKVVHGFADNMLTTTIIASTVPVVFCPDLLQPLAWLRPSLPEDPLRQVYLWLSRHLQAYLSLLPAV